MIDHNKMMLVVSAYKSDQGLFLRFEREPYYAQKTRQIITERAYDNMEKSALLNNPDFCGKFIFWILVSLLVPLHDKWGRFIHRGCPIYPHHRGPNTVLRIDAENYEYKEDREFCADIPIETLDANHLYNDDILYSQIARTVLRYLPLGPFSQDEHSHDR